VQKPSWESQVTPEKLFRGLVLLCLLALGASAIYTASQAGALSDSYQHARDLTSYFFVYGFIFIFFYAEYRLVPRAIKCALHRSTGIWHAGASLALLLFGAINIAMLETPWMDPSSLLLWTTVLGEIAFVGNVIWSYVHTDRNMPVLPVVSTPQEAKKRQTPGPVTDDSAKNIGWPKSPVKLFGIGAGFFAAGGVVSLILNFPAFKIPVPISGELHFLPFGLMWLAAGAPFGFYAVLYKFLTDAQRIVFLEKMNRIHFVVTIIAVLDMVRVFMGWEQTLVSKMAALYFGPEIEWLIVLFGASAVVFVINIVRSMNNSSVGT
jgi:hypothetical protein